MKFALAMLAVAALLIPASRAQDASIPTSAGMYCKSPSGYTRMELATSSGFKTGGMAKSMLTYGVAKIKGKWLYRGPSAASELADHRPAFTLVSQVDVSKQAVALIRFDVKKDHREAEYVTAGAWSGVTEENKDTIPVSVNRLPNSNDLTVIPQADLPAGEYLLIADSGNGYDGYDFGVK